MASSINASTSGAGGVITTADNTGILQLQSGGTTIATISSTGITTQVGAPAFSAYGNINQSISSGTATKISFNLEEFDTNSNYDSTTNYRFTPTVAGYYQVNLACRYETTTAFTTYGEILIQIRKNGSAIKRGWNSNGPLTNAMNNVSSQPSYLITQCNAIVYLNGSTDYIEGWFLQGTGQTQTLRADAEISYFQAAMIRSA
jgi:hypothetical protein